jgi:hypothetical protein
VGPNCDGSECAHKAEIEVIIILSSREQSRFFGYFFHHRSTGDQHVYVQKHPNSAHASSADFLEASRVRGELTLECPVPRRDAFSFGSLALRPALGLSSSQFDPTPDRGRLEIPQCSDLLLHLVCYHWVGSAAGSAAPHADSKRFRFSPRTCWLLCGRLSVR